MSTPHVKSRPDVTAVPGVGDLDGASRTRAVAARPANRSGVLNARQLEGELLTAKELEAMLKIDVKTIYSYVQRGRIPYVRLGSSVRFIRQQIFDWISDHNYRPHPTHGNGAKRRQ